MVRYNLLIQRQILVTSFVLSSNEIFDEVKEFCFDLRFGALESEVKIPDELTAQVPAELRNNACFCRIYI
jgi:hypothetical protein